MNLVIFLQTISIVSTTMLFLDLSQYAMVAFAKASNTMNKSMSKASKLGKNKHYMVKRHENGIKQEKRQQFNNKNNYH